MMKKLLCLALALTLLLSACAFAVAEEDTGFEPVLCNALDSSLERWYATSLNRAMLTVLLALDYNLGVEGEGAIDTTGCVADTTFVGRDGTVLVVYYHCIGNDLILLYAPDEGLADYTIIDSYDDEMAQFVLGSVCDDGYYENDMDDIISANDMLTEVLSSD